MKLILYTIAITFFCAAQSLAQNVIGNVNSGAVSGNNLMYSVGEIFVKPVNADEASSGTMGIVYRIQLLDITIGMATVEFDNTVKLYPNPASDIVTISFDSPTPKAVQQVSILTVSGQTVLTQTLQNRQLDLSQLASGTYLLQTDNTSLKPIRFVKQ